MKKILNESQPFNRRSKTFTTYGQFKQHQQGICEQQESQLNHTGLFCQEPLLKNPPNKPHLSEQAQSTLNKLFVQTSFQDKLRVAGFKSVLQCPLPLNPQQLVQQSSLAQKNVCLNSSHQRRESIYKQNTVRSSFVKYQYLKTISQSNSEQTYEKENGKIGISIKRQRSNEGSTALKKIITKATSMNPSNVIGDYTLSSLIGTGSYANVRLAIDQNSNKKVAVKIYEKFKLCDEQKQANVQTEISVMKLLNHENCIQLYEVIETPRNINIVMEYVGASSLFTYVKEQTGRRLSETDSKQIFLQIIKGIEYLHEKNIAHRDIKMENILLDKKKKVKIIDFGFSILQSSESKLSVVCGTPSYMAPELVRKKEYNGSSVDIWACGILLYQMLCGTFPFRGVDDRSLFKEIQKCDLRFPSYLSHQAKSLVSRILKANDTERISASEILNDPWIISQFDIEVL